ncbi:ribose-phosphate diphosphokinase [Sphingobacterium spiritivorum ATCC 33300]|uniref:ribose-phosphate diphosphokinase n=2 Tax=Sphingobacterium spiritivorum TaxID=258 RepID=A0A380B9W6_SPHSI|nr:MULTISPECIES: ribose-phosphate pyrophosphokinase [Sphingobacterium]EEI92727.1 ribose-phosphate diphosphokinase [Sphingobacterium spiritivorum ATCC 33300]QQS94213.1 ribose-phosphate pyrophosphokinase [Sphingobacterium spiritivorum]QQT27053.1 ribose-phosphate pyrophosphokinase [Sphingobacterium spiritivorum]SUI96942.1 Ribose-phosphate pyrophosphokinase [Sphingobacterium spiritivorum]
MPLQFNTVKLFAGSGTQELSEKIAKSYGKPLGDKTLSKFSDGEIQPFYNESVRGSDVFLIQSTNQPTDNLLELLLMIDAAKRASAHYITAVVPYFGFARQDRKDKPRVAIGAKMIANLITASGAHRIMTMDLHAAQIQGFFDIPVDHLDGSVIFVPYIKSLNLPNLTIASPDMGGSYRARTFAKFFNAEVIICDKRRKRANEIESMSIIGDVTGQDVVLIDDICDTAGTLSKAAALIMENGAKSVRAVCTHAVLSGKAYETIENSVLTEMIVTDTIKLDADKMSTCSKIKVLSTADLFANAIKNVNEHSSISDLFQVD